MSNIVDMGGWSADRRQTSPATADEMAAFQAHERRTFEERFPPIAETPGDAYLPPITWGQVVRQLEHLAPSPLTRNLVNPLVEQLREETRWRTPEMVLTQLILISALVLEPPADADPSDGSPPSGEAPMP